MSHLLITHPAMLAHGVPAGHPERPARLEAVLAALRPLGMGERLAPLATHSQLLRVHPPAFLAAMAQAFPGPGEGVVALDAGDTFVDPGSQEAALRAAGAVVAGVDSVMSGEARSVFCAVRPPGHHAEPAQAMGFCLYNNIAVGALHALEVHGLERVAVIDFDVHHGNGTQALAYKEARLFFASTHGSPLYPGTGRRDETGLLGNVVNRPLSPGTDGVRWRAVMAQEVLPALEAADPQLILVSAGFDAHRNDPLADLALEEADYAWIGAELGNLALRVCKGRVVSALEGGYDLTALAASAAAYVSGLTRALDA
ncbi:MAG: histone deacetylase family protein [Caulobacterales bacterium]